MMVIDSGRRGGGGVWMVRRERHLVVGREKKGEEKSL
jgi:hypothetical protein